MPPLPAAPGTLKCVFDWQVGTDAGATSRFFIGYTGVAPDASAIGGIATAILASYTAHIKPLLSTSNALNAITVQDLASSMGLETVAPDGTNGTLSGESLIDSTCLLANLAIPRHYRGGKPRMYLPLGTRTQLNGSRAWQGSFLTSFNAAWAAFIAAFSGVTFDSTVLTVQKSVSYYAGFTAVPNPVTGKTKYPAKARVAPQIDTVTSVTGNTVLGTQRRRLRRSA